MLFKSVTQTTNVQAVAIPVAVCQVLRCPSESVMRQSPRSVWCEQIDAHQKHSGSYLASVRALSASGVEVAGSLRWGW